MARRLISSGSSFEQDIGYSRAVVDDEWVFVSGTTGFDYASMTIPEGIVAQTEQCLLNIGAALAEAGASFADVVRVTYVLPNADDFPQCWPVLRRYFGESRPAAMMISAGLADLRMKIEIEVTARKRTAHTESTADREFVHSRLIDAPRERVFKAFSDPARLARWWGPNGFTSTFQAFDLRPGGTWRFVMHGPDGTNYPNESVFVEVAAPERIVFDHLSGHHFRMTLTLDAQGAKTVVGWRQVFDTAAERQRIAEFVIEANEQNLDRLAAEVLTVA